MSVVDSHHEGQARIDFEPGTEYSNTTSEADNVANLFHLGRLSLCRHPEDFCDNLPEDSVQAAVAFPTWSGGH